MSNPNNSVHEKGISVKCEEGPENCPEKPRTDGGIAGNDEKGRISDEAKSVLLFTAVSVVAGYISFILTPARPGFIPITSLLLVLGIAAAIFAGAHVAAQKLVGKKNMQWFMGNGGAIYLFLWFVSWIIFYNVL